MNETENRDRFGHWGETGAAQLREWRQSGTDNSRHTGILRKSLSDRQIQTGGETSGAKPN